MFIVGLLQWWYGAGWARQLAYVRDHIIGVYDYFSIDLLISSWFSPFRQISAGKVQGSLEVQWRAFVDRTISRFIGAFMRTALIVGGIIALMCFSVASIAAVVLWALLPVAPVVGLLLTLIGWMPWTA